MNTCIVAGAPAVNTNGIKTLLANGLSSFPIKGNPVFCYGPNFLLAEELFAKTVRSFEICILVNNNFCEK